jgi:hypothetical protein
MLTIYAVVTAMPPQTGITALLHNFACTLSTKRYENNFVLEDFPF